MPDEARFRCVPNKYMIWMNWSKGVDFKSVALNRNSERIPRSLLRGSFNILPKTYYQRKTCMRISHVWNGAIYHHL